MVALSAKHDREGMRRVGVGERMGAAETPKRQTTCGWALSRATLLCLVQQLTVAADEDWTTVYHDTFTSEEIVAPAGAIDAALADLVCAHDGAVAEACPVLLPCRREQCVSGCCGNSRPCPQGGGFSLLSQPCAGAGQSWADRWSVDSEPVAAQLCGDVHVAGGYDSVGQGQVLSGHYPLPQLPEIPGLSSGHQELQVSLQLYAIDSWDGEVITVVADDTVVWSSTYRHQYDAENLCGGFFTDGVLWANFTLRHSADALRLTVSNTLNQHPDDESIALSQVVIAVNAGTFLPSARGVRAETWTTSEEYDSFPSDVAEVPWIVSKGNVLLRTPQLSERVEMLDAFQSVLSAQERADNWLILLLRLSTCLLVEVAGTYNIRMVGAGATVLHVDGGEPVSEQVGVLLDEGYRLITVDVVVRDTLRLEWRRADNDTQAWDPVGGDILYVDNAEHTNGRCPDVGSSSIRPASEPEAELPQPVASSPRLNLIAAPQCSGWSVSRIGTDNVSCAESSGICRELAGPTEFILHVGPSPANSWTVAVDYREFTNGTVAYCSDVAVNEQESYWSDTFAVSVNNTAHTVAVTRTDLSRAWGQDLQLSCAVGEPSVLARRDITIPGGGSVWLGIEGVDHRPLPDVWIDGEPAAGSECPEVGEVKITGDEIVSVSLRHAFSRPLVFASAALAAEESSDESACSVAVVRVSKVRKVEARWVFDLAMVQPSCGSGAEVCRWTVSWLAWAKKEGVTGQVTSTSGRFVAAAAEFTASASPTLFATIQRYSDSDQTTDDDALWLVPRSDGLTVHDENLASFRLKFQTEEGIDVPTTSSADIAWLVMPAGESSFWSCGVYYQAGSLENVDNHAVALAFAAPFLPFAQPTYSLLSHVATFVGSNPASSFRINRSLFVSEENCGDDEQEHGSETINWLRIWRNPLELSAGSHVIEASQSGERCLSAVNFTFAEHGDCQVHPALLLGMSHGTCDSLLRNGESCELGCTRDWYGQGSLISCESGVLRGPDTQACALEADCQGKWSVCNSHCRQVFSVALPPVGGGAECVAQDGAVADCAPGEGMCPSATCASQRESVEAKLSPFGTAIVVTFTHAARIIHGTKRSFLCNTLLTNFTRGNQTISIESALGSDEPMCLWIDERTFEVPVGFGGISPMPGDLLRTYECAEMPLYACRDMSTGASGCMEVFVGAQIQLVQTPAPPRAIITGSTMLGRCASSFALDSMQSTGGGPQPLNIQWSYISASGTDELTLLHADLRSPVLNVHFNASKWITGSHTLRLTVTNVVTGMSHSDTVNVVKTTADLPRVRIIGPPEITTVTSRPLAVRAAAELPDCVTDVSQLSLSFAWSLYNASTDHFDALFDGPAGILPPFTFIPGETRRMRVSVSSSDRAETDQAIAEAVVICQRSPLVAFISGGTMRLVGRNASFILDGSASYDPDNLSRLPADAYSWSCTEHERRNGSEWQTIQAPCPVNPASGPTWGLEGASFSAESRYRFVLMISRDDRSASAETIVEVSPGSAPDVLISGGTAKANPTERLVLYGNAIPSFAQEVVKLTWSALVADASSTEYEVFDLTQPGVLSTTVHGKNLVVHPGQLDSGKHYTFVLNAAGRDAVGYSQVTVAINSPPCCGIMTVQPEQGSAVLDPFSISAQGWHDEDVPLAYLFATALSAAGSAFAPLTDSSPENFATVTLPAGSTDDDYRRYILLEVRDIFDAATSSSVVVNVRPFTPPENTSIQDTATALLKTSLATQDTSAVGQIVLGMCEALNDDASDSFDSDAEQAREVLLDALMLSTSTNSDASLSESTVSRSTAIMVAVTAAPTQLSARATDKSLAFAKRLSSSDRLSPGAIDSIAETASNLLDASSQQFVENRRRRLAVSVADESEVAYNRSNVLTGIVNDCASSIARRHVIGEGEQSVETDGFELRVSTDTIAGWENAQVGNGLVAVPPGAFADYTDSGEPIASKIVKYASIGPLFYAPLAPTNDSVRGTGLVTVTFAREGEDLQIRNLSLPFVVQLPVDPSQDRANAEALCGHFDPATQDWVVDGELKGWTVDRTRIVCSYNHLTDFIAFLGPEISANEVSIVKIFSAEWLQNPAGAVVSLSVLLISIVSCSYSMHQYKRMAKQVKDPVHVSHFHRKTDAFASQRLRADAKHVPLLRRWAVRMQQQYQLGAMCCGHEGDPYAPSQRFMVFMMAMLVSLFINILFFESEEPVCTRQTVCNTTCYGTVCQNDTCVETNEIVCEEDDLGNGFLASVISALVGLPIVGSLHVAFSWMRKPLEKELAHKVLMHEKKAGTLVVRSAANLAAGDWAFDNSTSPKSDPYAIVFWNDKKIGRTKVLKSTVTPRWDAAFNLSTLVGAINAESENVLRVEIWEWDQLSGDDFLGAVHLAGQGSSFLPRIERSYSLESVRGEKDSLVQGKVCLQFLEEPPSSPGLVDTRRCGGPAVHHDDKDSNLLQKRYCCCCRHDDRYAKSSNKIRPVRSDTTQAKAAKSQKAVESSQRYLIPGSTMLPPGWEAKKSRTSGKLYYYNRETGMSTFDLPSATDEPSTIRPLNSSLQSIPSKQPGENHSGDDSTVEPLPAGWVARKSNSKGKIYYYNSATNESVWEHPAGSVFKVKSSGERPRDPSELSELPGTTPVKNEPAIDTSTETSQLGPSTLPALELKIHSPVIRRLPPMTGLTPALASLQASRRRSEANAAKVAAEKTALSNTAVQSNSSNEVGVQKKPTLSSFLKRGAEEQREIELRRMHHASVAYCYGLAIGVFSSLFIAATAVNFGPDKTLEWLGVTGLSLIWRMFVIEPIKVLVCGGFEGVAGLITGEADDWTEGFADAFADAAEGGIEDAGVAAAGLAAMDNVSRQREKRDAAVKLAAVNAFQAAAHKHHNVPLPKTPGVRPTSVERSI